MIFLTIFADLIIPVIMVVGGYMMLFHPAKNRNSIYGYRTARSMKTEETWKFAHDHAGRTWTRYGVALLVVSVLFTGLSLKASSNAMAIVTVVMELAQCIVLFVAISRTQKALKENFDEEGRRKPHA